MPYYPKRGKVRSKPVDYDGHLFPSQTECEVYKELKYRQEQGYISNLTLQPKFDLFPRLQNVRIIDKLIGWDSQTAAVYTADMLYTDNATGRKVCVEAKGFFTDVAKLKIRVFLQKYLPEYDFVIVTAVWGSHKKVAFLKELKWHWYLYDDSVSKPKLRKKK